VVDADAIARDVVEPGTPGLQALIDAFGQSILDQNGRLDRAGLGATIFGNDVQRKKLENILHPLIATRSVEVMSALAKEGHKFSIYEAALIFEKGLEKGLDGTMLVTVPIEVQLERLIDRDGLEREAAQARLDAQMPLSEKMARASVIIDNSGPLQETAIHLSTAWEKLTGEEVPFHTMLAPE